MRIMNELFSRGMAAATRLTQAGRLAEATSLLQNLLQGKHGSTPTNAKPTLESPLIEGTVVNQRPHVGKIAKQRARPKNNVRDPIPQAPGTFTGESFSNNAGSRCYKLYTPTSTDPRPRPLIVMLHGCTQSPDDFAAGTRMNICAEEHGCFVLYPEQATSANASKCWNWFKTSDQQRDQGEPLIIADLTRHIIQTHGIDPARVYVAGLSAGGAAAAVLAETYPDLYRAVGVHSGLACGAARDMPSAFMAMKGQGLPTHTRTSFFVPTIVFHGDSDATVHPSNGAAVVARAAERSNLQTMTETGETAGRSFTRCLHRDKAGRTVVEDWVIHGAGHNWSGGSRAGSFTDDRGPDASREMLRFFLGVAISPR